MHDLEAQIRERAYHLWLAEGAREGEADRHWLTAEREMIATAAVTIETKAVEAPATRRRAAKPAAKKKAA